MIDEPHPAMQRRLAAILSADAVGYSRLMGDDDVATVHTLSLRRTLISEAVTSFSGRVVDAPGDNFLAEFASAVDAVNAASEIQIRLGLANAELPEDRRMEFRIGINLGDVLVEEGRIYGDGVNVAARLESEAVPGGILISSSIYDQVHGKVAFDFVDRGKLDLKNIPEPVRVYSLEAAKPLPPVLSQPATPKPRPRLALVGAGIAAAFIIAGGAWYFVSGDRVDSVEAAPAQTAPSPSDGPRPSAVKEERASSGAANQPAAVEAPTETKESEPPDEPANAQKPGRVGHK